MGSDEGDESEQALRLFGLQAQPTEGVLAGPVPAPLVCEVHPAHVAALELFLSCTGQWVLQLGGMGGAHWRGADASALAQMMVWQGVTGKAQNALARQYRMMEAEGLRVLNEREAQAARKA